jgi:predicted signal transduction protein with EAL and GGDEF domain
MLENLESMEQATLVLNSLMQRFKPPFWLDNHEIVISCSVGVALYPDNGESAEELLSHADAAMYRAKQEGRNTYEFYAPEMTASAFEHVFLENALHNAVKQQELVQVYQPQVSLADGRLIGCETLVRWHHPQQGVIPPQRFIPVAEQNGTIGEIDEWMLRTACRRGRSWLDQGFDLQRISLNASGSQVQRPGFAESIFAALDETGFPYERLEIEVTETFVMQRQEVGIEQLKRLHAAGIFIAIDDFGTGYSSLSYLKNLPFNKIKLDQSFTRDINRDKDTRSIVKAIIDLAQALGKVTIAEGIETAKQAATLLQLGCDQAQGYHFGRPLSEQEFGLMLERQKDETRARRQSD